MKINTLIDLENLEAKISLELRRYDLDEVLIAVHEARNDKRAFVLAGVCLFGIRYSLPPILKRQKSYRIEQKKFEYICHLVVNYLLTDPSTLDSSANTEYKGSTLISIMLRLAGNQFVFNVEFWGQFARTLYLYIEMPKKLESLKNIPFFDIESSFKELNKVSLEEFIHIGFVSFTAAHSISGITGGYFQKAKLQGFKLPDDETINLTLDKLAADQYQLRELYEECKQTNRLYAPYDFNPLLVFPFVRPWRKNSNTTLDEDRIIAPVPNLILYRFSEGIYHQLFSKHRDKFARYFGFLFEHYVGEILNNCVESNQIISESELRKTYPEKSGKVPDWIVIEGNTATFFECKATGFSRKALATSDEDAIDYSVSQVKKGLVQLHEFKDACDKKTRGLEKLAAITKFNLRVVTYEPFYLINSTPFRDIINSEIELGLSSKSISIQNWHILSTDELEKVQPHMNCGIPFNEIIDKLKTKEFNGLIEELHNETHKTFEDSFLMVKLNQLFKDLGLPL